MTIFSKDRSFFKSAAQGKTDKVESFLQTGIDPNTTTKTGRTALMIAAREGHSEIVRLLLRSGAEVNTRDSDGETALTWSVSRRYVSQGEAIFDKAGLAVIWLFEEVFSLGHSDVDVPVSEQRALAAAQIMQALIEAGADVHAKNNAGDTALILAAQQGYTEAVRGLIEAGAGTDAQDKHGATALMYAIEKDYTQIIEALVQAGADLTVEDVRGLTALRRAVDKNQPETARLLLQAGPTVKAEDADHALGWAAREGHADIVALLVKAGASSELMDAALVSAAGGGHVGVMQTLLAAGADVNAQIEGGFTALMAAELDAVRLLIAAGADVHATNDTGGTALIGAASRHNTFKIIHLIAAGANVNATNALGETARVVAKRARDRAEDKGSRNWDTDGVTRIFKKAERVHALRCENIDPETEVEGQPILLVAAELGQLWLVRALIDAGADLEIRCSEGETALMKAAEWGHLHVVEALISAGADVNAKTPRDEAVLMWASTPETVQALVEAGADVHARDNDQWTPLISLIAYRPTYLIGRSSGPRRKIVVDHVGMIRALVAAGVEVDATDKDGKTALMYAAEGCSAPTIRHLIAAGADIHVRDKRGHTALKHAGHCGDRRPAQGLRDAGAKE